MLRLRFRPWLTQLLPLLADANMAELAKTPALYKSVMSPPYSVHHSQKAAYPFNARRQWNGGVSLVRPSWIISEFFRARRVT